jgi:putative ABC transport system permease protein
VEAAMLSVSGGSVGLVLALTGTSLVSGVDLGGYKVQAPMSPDIVIIALAVAIVVGLGSGLYPAVRAANLDPIQSLRHE